ncbi:YciI family protein [Streptomyces gulbargensis]|uniref:YciI family protein n=2 Tax=Streptomyces TaxID=1883 RepID=A0ABP7MHR6_9ACTN
MMRPTLRPVPAPLPPPGPSVGAGSLARMFVLELTYTAPVERADALLDAHVAWLDEQYAAGVFIASGRKNPRDGGVILAAGVDRAEIEKIAAADPFTVEGVCAYRITEFYATKTAEDLSAYRERLPS